MTRPEYVSPKGKGAWLLEVWVQPGAKANALQGEYQGCLKVRLAAPAVDNKANKALVSYISSLTGIKESGIHMERGHTTRRKALRIEAAVEPDWSALAG